MIRWWRKTFKIHLKRKYDFAIIKTLKKREIKKYHDQLVFYIIVYWLIGIIY